jgi:hypothetical protein
VGEGAGRRKEVSLARPDPVHDDPNRLCDLLVKRRQDAFPLFLHALDPRAGAGPHSGQRSCAMVQTSVGSMVALDVRRGVVVVSRRPDA